MRHVRTRDFTVYHESVISRCQFFQMISISILSIVYAFYLLSCCQFFQVISMYFSIDTSLFKPYCISVTFNKFAESKREQSLAFCLSIIMCMNFIFYLVVGFSKQFHLAYGFEANKMCSSKKKMHLSSSTAQRVRASLKTYIKRRACSINYSKYTIRLSDEKIQKTTRQSRESLYVHLFFA